MLKYFNSISCIDQAIMDRSLLKVLLKKSDYDCLLIFDSSGIVVGSVDGEKALNWPELVGVSFRDLLEDPDFDKEHYKKFLSTNKEINNSDTKNEVKIRTHSGELLDIVCSFGYLTDLPSYLDGCRVVLIKLKQE